MSDSEITVRGVRFWIGDPAPAPTGRLRAAGDETGPPDVVVPFSRIGRDGKPSRHIGRVRFDPVRRRAAVEFEERTATYDAKDAREGLERFLSTHLLAGRIVLIP